MEYAEFRYCPKCAAAIEKSDYIRISEYVVECPRCGDMHKDPTAKDKRIAELEAEVERLRAFIKDKIVDNDYLNLGGEQRIPWRDIHTEASKIIAKKEISCER